MLYDLNAPFDREKFKDKCNFLFAKSKNHRVILELTEKQTRTKSQNAYLHVIIRYLALQLGHTELYTKQIFYKLSANHDLFFLGWESDPITKMRIPKMRHSHQLTEEEMSLSIDRFLDWSVQNTGVRLPAPNEEEFITECEIEVLKHKQYL